MSEIEITGPHMGTILMFCDYPSIQQGQKERAEERKKMKPRRKATNANISRSMPEMVMAEN